MNTTNVNINKMTMVDDADTRKDDFGSDQAKEIPIDQAMKDKGLSVASFAPLKKRIDRIFRAIGDITAH